MHAVVLIEDKHNQGMLKGPLSQCLLNSPTAQAFHRAVYPSRTRQSSLVFCPLAMLRGAVHVVAAPLQRICMHSRFKR